MSTTVYVYCMGSIAGPGFLNGLTASNSVDLLSIANGGQVPGTVWTMTQASGNNTYFLQCQGTSPGSQYLSGDPTHQAVELAPSHGGSTTEWILAPVATSNPQMYTVQLADTSDGPLYLNGYTVDGSLNLASDPTLSGAQWLVLRSV
jgi:hypothetical protein